MSEKSAIQELDDLGTKIAPTTWVWGGRLESGRFLKVPKIIFYLARFDRRMGDTVQPRHILLLLALAARKYGDTPIRAFWSELASGLGVKTGTVRKWAYELRALGLLRIYNHRKDGVSGVPGNDRNSFDIEPFVQILRDADATWRLQRINSPEALR